MTRNYHVHVEYTFTKYIQCHLGISLVEQFHYAALACTVCIHVSVCISDYGFHGISPAERDQPDESL